MTESSEGRGDTMQFSMSSLVRAARRVLAAGVVAATAMLRGHITGNQAAPAEASATYTVTIQPSVNDGYTRGGNGAIIWRVYPWAGYTLGVLGFRPLRSARSSHAERRTR
ncbi:MAG: hypothetical protein NTZ05_07980 [Chloroflexi bacterium]|nr:hypothetical protein [Chloroflexota bacterium]